MSSKYIIYGAGKEGKRLLSILGMDQVGAFCDKNAANLVSIMKIPVIAPEDLLLQNDANVIVAIKSLKAKREVSEWLEKHGISFEMAEEYLEIQIKDTIENYEERNKRVSFRYSKDDEYIITEDLGCDAGNMGAYFYQDLWAAKHIFSNKPVIHYDIGSRVDGFITHLLSFGQKVTQIDIRPMKSNIDGWNFIQSDATNLDCFSDESINSLSALCSLEHFGLGRYGDDIDPEACFKCFSAIQKKIEPGGMVYISVPISGREHLEFNAHRVFHPQTIIDCFGKMELMEFSAAEYGTFYSHVDVHAFDSYDKKGGKLFGLFQFRKKHEEK